MSWHKASHDVRQLSVIESAYSEEIAFDLEHDSKEICTEGKHFAMADSSASSSAIRRPEIPSRISSLALNESTDSGSQDTCVTSKDIGKSDAASSNSSGPRVAEMADPGQQDPFAQESEGGVQYRTMAWW